MYRYSNVPLEASNVCPNHIKHNKLADEANKRLQQSGPDSAWRIFYYADSIFTGMRNTATPGQPLGINPAEDEWWKVYNAIEYPTASTGNGNWPLALAGTPQGANVMNPLNAYIFGRKTSENKKLGLEKQGPWAEGNIFDGGLVEGSFGVLDNRSYFESSFRIRGALMPNDTYSSEGDKFRKENWSRYLPSPHSPHFLSQGLHTAGRQADKFFREYASNTIYMRYAPSVYSGSYKRYPQAPAGMYNPVITPPEGVLKRKNAAKDLLRFALWCYIFYFRGSEAQRSIFCHAKSWAVPKTEFTATDEYVGQAIFGEKTTQDKGPLTICDVGFDFNEYYSRQNLLAPALGCKLIGGKYAKLRDGTAWRGYGPSVDGTGNPEVEQYRPKFSFMVMQSTSDEGYKNGYLGKLNPDPSSASNLNETSWIANKDKESSNDSGVMVENYDDLYQAPNFVDYYNNNAFKYELVHEASKLYGKGIRVSAGNEEKLANSVVTDDLVKNVHPMLMKCSYDNNSSSRLDSTKLMYKNISGFRGLESKNIRFVLAGYYLQTSPVENGRMAFKLRIWAAGRIKHETLINHRNCYQVNRNAEADVPCSGRKAFVYNKLHYFKKGIDSNNIKFEIVPVVRDIGTKRNKAYNNRVAAAKYKKEPYDKCISFGNPYTKTIEKTYPDPDTGSSAERNEFLKDRKFVSGLNTYDQAGGDRAASAELQEYKSGEDEEGNEFKKRHFKRKYVWISQDIIDQHDLKTGDAVRLKWVRRNPHNDDKADWYARGGSYSTNLDGVNDSLEPKVFFVRVDTGSTSTVIERVGPVEGGRVDQDDGEDPPGQASRYAEYKYSSMRKVWFFLRRDRRLTEKKAFSHRELIEVTEYEKDEKGEDKIDENGEKIPVMVEETDSEGNIVKTIVSEAKEQDTTVLDYDAFELDSGGFDIFFSGEIASQSRADEYWNDASVYHKAPNVSGDWRVKRPTNISHLWSNNATEGFVMEKMTLDDHLFKVDLEPVILLKGKPSFHDAYSLLRVTTAKQNRLNFSSGIVLGDAPGVGTVGHHFNDANKVFHNYIKYASGENIFGSSAVPALQLYVSANPIYESIRKFVSSYLRMADRRALVNYTVENGRGVLYFRRYAWGLPKKFKATTLRNMEPSVEPVGYFEDLLNSEKGHAKFKYIEKGEKYKVLLERNTQKTVKISYLDKPGSVVAHKLVNLNDPLLEGATEGYYYSDVKDEDGEDVVITMKVSTLSFEVTIGTVLTFTEGGSFRVTKTAGIGKDEIKGVLTENKVKHGEATNDDRSYYNGTVFTAEAMGFVNQTITNAHQYGVFEYDGITTLSSSEASSGYGKVSNEWIMFLTSTHYHPANSNIYKPSIYSDIMGFLNNRCHHRSREYERSIGTKYDMIRTELLRVPRRDAFFPGPWLNVFLSKSSSKQNYIFNTNNPARGNLSMYGDPVDYRKSCPAVFKKPYKVMKTTVVNFLGQDMTAGPINPSAYTARDHRIKSPAVVVRVELDRPLDGTGRLNTGARGWDAVSLDLLQQEPYRTDENAIVEYLAHHYHGRAGYNCKRLTVGDYAPDSDAVEGGGYRHFGACFPRFYFLKLIPRVSKNSLLDVEPYNQMEFYSRAIAGAFINPYNTNVNSFDRSVGQAMNDGEPKASSKTGGAQESAQKAGEKEFEAIGVEEKGRELTDDENLTQKEKQDRDSTLSTNTEGEDPVSIETRYKDDEGNWITADEAFRLWHTSEYHTLRVGDKGDRFTNPQPEKTVMNSHWKASEIFSRSSEEDPTDYEYTDPRDTEIGG